MVDALALLPPLLTVGETMVLLHLSRSTIDRRLAAGEWPSIRLGQGKRAPVRILRDGLPLAIALTTATRGRRYSRQAEAELHAALVAVGGVR